VFQLYSLIPFASNSHRHPGDHDCAFAQQSNAALEARQQHSTAQAERQRTALSKAKLKSALKLSGDAPMAAKLRLLKMKSRATKLGSDSAKDTRCLLIGVKFGESENVTQGGSLLVPCSWSAGKLVDRLCSHFDLINSNNDPSLPSWGLYSLTQHAVLPTATQIADVDNGALLVLAQASVVYSQELEAYLILLL
jgi:hypothetical protein